MAAPLRLADITRENFKAVACLEVHDHQRGFLASNSYSIAEASFNPALRTRAIYSGDVPIGFAMYVVPEPHDEQPGCYAIWRFMIDRQFQDQGHGRVAMDLLLREIDAKTDARKILISYKPDNPLTKRFYASFGFQEEGLDADQREMVAVLRR